MRTYEERAEYYRQYTKANREKRAATSKAWRENNRERYNELQRIHNEKRRRAAGIEPRRPKTQPVAVVPREVVQQRPSVEITGESLTERFMNYRRALRA